MMEDFKDPNDDDDKPEELVKKESTYSGEEMQVEKPENETDSEEEKLKERPPMTEFKEDEEKVKVLPKKS